jgi:hypothetical protein
MKAIACVLAFWTGACLDNDPATVDDVIKSLDAIGAPDMLIADGHSPIAIQICTTDQQGRDPGLTATLKASAGAWQIPDVDPKTATISMSQDCEQRLLIPGTDPGLFSVAGTIGTFTRVLPVTLQSAPIDKVRLGRQGLLSPVAASMLTITATLDVLANGRPSIGTLVTFHLTVDAPPGGVASLSDRELRIAQGSSVQTNLFVAQGVTQLTVTATAAPDGQPTKDSDPLVITP